jgi:tRNA pseudouridine38-40 synthase
VEAVEALDEGAMRSVLAAYEGWHDFKNLAHPKTTGKTRRLLLRAELEVVPRSAGGARYDFTFRSPGFLRHQVRNLVGVAVTAGLGRLPEGALEELLSGKGDRWRGARAPGRGLALWEIGYVPAESPFL